jgi:nucleotide-binding universal stress UspA family protein
MNIVVGVDGTDHGLAAARWAALEAKTISAPLSLVHVFSVPAVPSPAGPVRTPEQRRYARSRAEAILERARAVVDAELVDVEVDVSSELLEGPAARTLVELSRNARLVVLGSHSGLFLHHRLGSVVGACLQAASCPVVVIPVDVPSAVPKQQTSAASHG